MIFQGWSAPLMALALCTGHALAEETSKIDRSIKKEPVYQTKQPECWLLVFGLEAKTRVWIVRDGDVLYVDRNGDGDLTGEGERFSFKGGIGEAVKLTAGPTPITIPSLHTMQGDQCYVAADMEGKRLQYGTIKPVHRREEARILHFDGPLVMGLAHLDPSKQPLQRGSKPYDFSVLVNTAGSVATERWGPVINIAKYVPADVHPTVEFELASKKPDAAPIKLKAVLKERC